MEDFINASFSSDLKRQLKSNEYSNVIVAANNVQTKAHRMVI